MIGLLDCICDLRFLYISACRTYLARVKYSVSVVAISQNVHLVSSVLNIPAHNHIFTHGKHFSSPCGENDAEFKNKTQYFKCASLHTKNYSHCILTVGGTANHCSKIGSTSVKPKLLNEIKMAVLPCNPSMTGLRAGSTRSMLHLHLLLCTLVSRLAVALGITAASQNMVRQPAVPQVAFKRGFSGFSPGCGPKSLDPCPPPNRSSPAGFWGDDAPTGTCYDAAQLGLHRSWFYNWLAVPYYGQACDHHHQAAEYVPMMGQVGQAEQILNIKCGNVPCNLTKDNWVTANWIPSGVTHLLGYNEPDGHEGGKCTPAQAAKDWVHVQTLANAFDPPLVLVSPAPISGAGVDGHGYGLDGVSVWMDEFLGNCTHVVPECDTSLIKYMAMHDYHGNATAMMQRIRGVRARYGRQVWVTEWAILHWGSPPPRARMNAFMTEALPMLDASDDVARYAWFSARNTPNEMNGGSNMLPCDSLSMHPTSTGEIYSRLNGTGHSDK